MARASFTVRSVGPHVTIQDAGRARMMRFGVPASGPMDRKAFAIANAALGQALTTTGIEVSLGGLVLDCTAGAVTLAITGGGFIAELDDAPSSAWQVLTIRAGQRLALRPGRWGSWAYLAFAGQLHSPLWLGQAATHGPSGLGGGQLQTGQSLAIDDARVINGSARAIPCPVWARPRHLLHCVLGPQDRFFSDAALADLAAEPFTLTHAYDRMGVRLQGPPLPPQRALSLPSEAIVRGSVQVAGDGIATILLADHQTTGGYPKIATIQNDDLDAFVQCRPLDQIRFHLITPAEAVARARTAARQLADYTRNIASKHP
jgi:biotin-dependent carboxylase-like uncharacterized protein